MINKETSFGVMDKETNTDVINKETKEIASDEIRTQSQVCWGM